MTNNQKFDLETRTEKFGENIIRFIKTLPNTITTRPIMEQLIRCATSIGANYAEADDAESRLDFKHKLKLKST